MIKLTPDQTRALQLEAFETFVVFLRKLIADGYHFSTNTEWEVIEQDTMADPNRRYLQGGVKTATLQVIRNIELPQ